MVGGRLEARGGVRLVPGLLGPKPVRPGTPRPKTIFLLGLLGPGLLGLYESPVREVYVEPGVV